MLRQNTELNCFGDVDVAVVVQNELQVQGLGWATAATSVAPKFMAATVAPL